MLNCEQMEAFKSAIQSTCDVGNDKVVKIYNSIIYKKKVKSSI